MKVLVVGSGGREHALVYKIAQSSKVERIYCAPGNAGIEELAERVPVQADDLEGLAGFAQKEAIDLTVVGPEAPLCAGIADLFTKRGLRVFGPTRSGARLEGSKVFSKNFFRRHKIPTADYQVFDDPAAAATYIRARGAPVVVKADGEAKGKGAVVAEDLDTALAAVDDIMVKRVFGASGDRLIVEEFLVGQEMSVQVFTDGEAVVPMEPARDYKRALDHDEGPNTGGMGCYSPVPLVSPDIMNAAIRNIIHPTVAGLRQEGVRFRGVLYAGLMLTNGGLKILEYNVRFGDPEAQVVLPRIKTDLVDVLVATADGELSALDVEWHEDAAVCVVMASGGYPGAYETGKPVHGLERAKEMRNVVVFHAGTERRDGQVVTSGGRVLGVTGLGADIGEARRTAYAAVEVVSFEAAEFRGDIAKGVAR